MKKGTKDNIVDALNQYMVDHDLSANKVASQTAINPAYISAMRSKKYVTRAGDKDVDIAVKYFEKIANYIGLEIKKTYWSNVPTDQFKNVISILEDAKEFGYTNIIIGETGCGKTHTTRIFVKKNPTDTFMITVGSSDNIGDILDKISELMHIPLNKTKSKKIREIIKHAVTLKEVGNKPMIIFDEAEYMKLPALCAMKELYDNLSGIASIVLIGTDQLTRNITKLRKKNAEGIPQLYRRIKFGIRVLPAVDKTYKDFLPLIEPGLKRFLLTHCDNYGELHDVLVPAMREADRTSQTLNENFVRTILNMPKH